MFSATYQTFSILTDGTFLYASIPGTSEVLWISFSAIQDMYAFSVRACQDAHILLLNGGQYSRVVYSIVLGAESNTKTQLFKSGSELLAERTTLDILNCGEERWFVISWENKVINILQYSMNGRQILSYREQPDNTEELTAKDIHGMTLFTESGSIGEWALPKAYGV